MAPDKLGGVLATFVMLQAPVLVMRVIIAWTGRCTMTNPKDLKDSLLGTFCYEWTGRCTMTNPKDDNRGDNTPDP